MAHFKTLVFVCALFSMNAFAGMSGLINCQKNLNQNGFSRGLYFGFKENPIYLAKGANDEHNIMIYDSHTVYRCGLPNNTWWEKMSSCRKAKNLTTTYNVKLKSGLQTNKVSFDVQNSPPYDVTNADTWTYDSNIPSEVKLCEITCSEALDDKTKDKIATGIVEHMKGTVDRFKESMDRELRRKRGECDSSFGDLGRLVGKAFGAKQVNKDECLREADKSVSRKFSGEPNRLKGILESCGKVEGLEQAANDELKAYDKIAAVSRSAGPKAETAVSASTDDDEASGKK